MIATDSGTGYSRIELEESYPVMGLTSLQAEWEPSCEDLKLVTCRLGKGTLPTYPLDSVSTSFLAS